MEALRKERETGNPMDGFSESTPDTAAPVAPEAPAPAADATPEGGEDNESSELNVDWKAEAAAMKVERDKAVAHFQTLKGKYDAEVPRLSAEVQTLRTEMADLRAAPAATPETPAAVPAELTAKVAKLKEMYGDDIEDVINIAVSQATGRTSEAVDNFRKEFEPKLSQVDNMKSEAARSAADTMFDKVAEKHSDWEEINDMATFHSFLAEKLPGTTRTRQEAINEAVRLNEHEPIIHQLTTFKRRVNRGNSNLESQVVPGDTGKTEAPVTSDTKVYPSGEIDAFFKKMANVLSRGPLSAEQSRLETVYTRALHEGRVS